MLKIKEIKQTCYACPSQWEGKTTDDEEVYIRYRYGYLRCDINGKTVYKAQIGDDLDGCIDLEEALEHMFHVIRMEL